VENALHQRSVKNVFEFGWWNKVSSRRGDTLMLAPAESRWVAAMTAASDVVEDACEDDEAHREMETLFLLRILLQELTAVGLEG
jgi:hypothetical protein